MNIRNAWVKLLCIVLTIMFVDSQVIAQERQQRQRRTREWPWKGPPVGSEIKDFELPVLGGGTFKLSDHKGQIVIIELGACT